MRAEERRDVPIRSDLRALRQAAHQGKLRGRSHLRPVQELIEHKLAAAHESRRRCPVDGVEMAKEIVLNLILDRCPTCHGVWLDAGELEQLEDTIEQGLRRSRAGNDHPG